MGVAFDSWQHGIGQIALGKTENGKYAATVGGIVLSIPRQVGKTFLVGMIIIALCVLNPGMTVLWTAHRTRTATKTFQSMQGMVRKKKIRPHLAPSRNDGIRTSNGEQEIRFRNGSVIMFGAREAGFGRGFDEVDIEVFDEAQILSEKALEDMVPATNQSRQEAGALLFFMGTPPRPTDPGEEFTNRRTAALAAKPSKTGPGHETNMVYVEFSADEDADPDDHKQWAKANPSYPDRTPLESMMRMRANLTDDDSFRREALGIWDPTGTPEVIDAASWGRVADPASMAIDRLTLAIDVALDRSISTVAIAGQRADGLWHVEVDDQRKSVEWVSAWVKSRAEKNRLHAVVVDELSGLVERRNGRNYLIGTDVVVTLAASEGRDMAIACGKFYDAVMEATPKLRHTDQPQLNVALSVARKRKLGAGWAWNRKDATSDITPVVASTLALWGAQKNDVERPTRRRTSERTAVVL
ncbi:terminase large subunit domain-containing protein [Microbacterium hydrocarbonoxydans]|uniref:terminase large subunit domain-containing protein n=1 Tax=Microbacterium hydrocarbonoxydans TaxID=273678 RepID=UPI003D972E6E